MSDIVKLSIAAITAVSIWAMLSTAYGVMQQIRASRMERSVEEMTKKVYSLLSAVSDRLRESPVQHRQLQEQHRDILSKVDTTRQELVNMILQFHSAHNGGIHIQTGGSQSNAKRDNVGGDRNSRDDAGEDINNA